MFKNQKGFIGIAELVVLSAFIVTLMVSGASEVQKAKESCSVPIAQVMEK